jgi:hypothetical protein
MNAVHLMHELLIAQQNICSKIIHRIICLELLFERFEGMQQAPPHGLQDHEPQFSVVRGRPDVTHHALIQLGYDGHRTVRNEMDQHEAASR